MLFRSLFESIGNGSLRVENIFSVLALNDPTTVGLHVALDPVVQEQGCRQEVTAIEACDCKADHVIECCVGTDIDQGEQAGKSTNCEQSNDGNFVLLVDLCEYG